MAVVAIAGWQAWGAAPDKVTLVVLPFDNFSQAEDQAYLADGVTEEIITELARVDPARLGVIARTTSQRYGRSGPRAGAAASDVARELDVDFVLEGSVQRHGDRLRVTVQLIDPDGDDHLWADTYDRGLGDLLGVEREIARIVASKVRLSIAPASAEAPPAVVRADAHDAYLRARFYAQQATVFSTERAIASYEAALAIEPQFALAHAGLARSLIFGIRTEPRMAMERARAAAERALALDRNLPEAHLAWALVCLYHDRDFRAAGAAFDRLLSLDPGNAEAIFSHAQYLTASGRFDDALSAARRALALDPFSTLIHHYVGRILLYAGRTREAIAHLHQTLELQPNYSWALLFLTVAHEQAGELDRAVEMRQRYWTALGVPADQVSRLGSRFAEAGYDAVRREWIAWLEGFVRERGYVTSSELAMLYGALGEKDAAFRWLRKAYEDHTRDLIYLRVYPELAPLRSDSRFAEIEALAFRLPR
jgi:TolB-like protein/Tfp pilus assembly protein PilF